MPTRAQVLIPITLAAVIVGVAGILAIPEEVTKQQSQAADFPKGKIRIDGKTLQVQVADTSARHARGLMFQEKLPYDKGMLFVFEGEEVRSMWMLNMQFALDVIWFDADGNVVHIEENAKPCKSALDTATCTYKNAKEQEAKYVLEVTAGFVDKFGISDNSKMEILSP